MKEIKLTNGSVALVDDEDYDRVVEAGNWHEDTHGHGKRSYAYRRFRKGAPKVYLHNFILIVHHNGLDTDHVNGNGLDCRKENLRRVDRWQNNLNNHNPRSRK